MTSEAISWAKYPMGPNMRNWLKITDKDYLGQMTEAILPSEKSNFLDFLLMYSQDHSIASELELVELADELLAMDLPLMVLKLIDNNLEVWSRNDFRALHTEGLSSMYCGELGRAEYCFKLAQEVAPIEPAPYVNLVQIMQQDERWQESYQWLEAGLKSNPNHFPIWELYYAYLTHKKLEPLSEIFKKAKEINSWAGHSFFADLDPDANKQTKASHLDPFYKTGERTIAFLVEYTGALGQAEEFEKIPMIIWEMEKSGMKLDWQLSLHLAQAHLAMNQHPAFLKASEKLIHDTSLPIHIKEELNVLIKEVKEEENNEALSH